MNNYQTYQDQGGLPQKRRPGRWWIWVIVVLAVLAALVICAVVLFQRSVTAGRDDAVYGEPYIAVLDVVGEMTTSESAPGRFGYFEESTYSQDYLLDTIDWLIEDEDNAALLLYINSPGGECLAADQLGRKIVEYREATGRPVYAYGAAYTASGAYWAGCTADRLILNRWCTTGSIGVTMGVAIDWSGLLDRYGVKAHVLASGAKKNDLTGLTPITDDTLALYQAMIDEYGYFVVWVSEQRDLPPERVRQLADGRIYTARQAVDLGLADAVGEYEDALELLYQQVGELPLYEFAYESPAGWRWLDLFAQLRQTEPSELSELRELLPPSGILALYDNGSR